MATDFSVADLQGKIFLIGFIFILFCFVLVCLGFFFLGGGGGRVFVLVLLSVDQTVGKFSAEVKIDFCLNVPQPLQLHLDQLCDVKLVMRCYKQGLRYSLLTAHTHTHRGMNSRDSL